MTSKELETERQKTRRFYEEVRIKLLEADRSAGGMLLYAQGAAVLQGVSPLVQQYGAIATQLSKVEEEKRKLG